MPDKLSLAIEEKDYILLPRGLASRIETKWIDNRVTLPISTDILKPDLRDYQREAVIEILKNHQGMIHVPTGRGKTVIALGAIAAFKQRTCIIVNQTHIAKQWIERAEEHIGFSPGLIGDGSWDEKDITIAMQQTLNSRLEELRESGWFDNWGAVFLDEQHHISADTYLKVVSSFPAKYRIGLSATKGKSPAKKKISELVFGPTIFKMEGLDITPEVRVRKTNFQFKYRPTKKIGPKVIRNNYNSLVKSLIENDDRNNLIARDIANNSDRCQLIVSRRINHLKELMRLSISHGLDKEKAFMLTGNESSEERLDIYKIAENGKVALFSTIADEALDIPRLDTIYLVYPSKNEETIKQQVGRIVRQHELKNDAIIMDYRDYKVGVLNNQFMSRLRKLYQPLKFNVRTL